MFHNELPKLLESNQLPNYLRKEYSFPLSKFILKNTVVNKLAEDQRTINYIDLHPKQKDGLTQTLVFIHGNPTWSYFFRHLIKHFHENFPHVRVVAYDHLGMGLSSKPNEGFDYTLKNHIHNGLEFLDSLALKNPHFILHDWGGAIGSGIALEWKKRGIPLGSMTYMNTAAFTFHKIPWRINLLRKAQWGEWFIRNFNAFSWPATFMAVKKPLTSDKRRSYIYPYNSYENRIATAKFVKDIPMLPEHPTYETLKGIEESLPLLKIPVQLIWGEKDFCFTLDFLNQFQKFFPQAKTVRLPLAGHYLIEDAPEEVKDALEKFLFSLPSREILQN